MNNKGQTLVMFVILIPVILYLLVIITDLGLLYIENKRVESTVSKAVDYYKEGKNVEEYINKNINNIDELKIDEFDGKVQIKLKKQHKGLTKKYTLEIVKEG